MEGASNRRVASQYGVSEATIRRHKEHIPKLLVKASEAQEIADAEHLQAELARYFDRVDKLFDACDRWLTDPDDPDRYDIGPRAGEISVTYETEDGKRRKAPLAELLERVESKTGRGVTMVETKHADPRDLLLKTASRLQAQLELLAKLLGELQQEGTTNIHLSAEWIELRTLIVGALEDHPEAKRAVLEAIGSGNGKGQG